MFPVKKSNFQEKDPPLDKNQLDFTSALKLEKKQKNQRRVTALLFFVLSFSSLLFYFVTYLKKTLPSFSFPFSSVSLSRPWTDKLLKELAKQPGDWAVYLKVLRGGEFSWGYQENRSFPAASLRKLVLARDYCQALDSSQIDPQETYSLQEKDKVPGAGLLSQERSGKIYLNRELLNLALSFSDNTAAAVLARRLPETSYSLSTTTPLQTAALLEAFYLQKDQNPCFKEVLSSLTNTAFENLLPAGLPQVITISHKVAQDQSYLADTALIFTPEKDYLLVIIADNVNRHLAEAAFPSLSRLIYLSLIN